MIAKALSPKERQAALNAEIYTYGKRVARIKRGVSSGDDMPEAIRENVLYGGNLSFDYFHLWRVNEYSSVETFGVAYIALPYWLVHDLNLLKHVLIWHDYDYGLDEGEATHTAPFN